VIPDGLLIHDVIVVNPASGVDAYGSSVWDYGAGATRTDIKAWLQQEQRSEPFTDGRAPDVERWLMITNHADIADKARIEWAGETAPVTFEVDGPPEPVYAGLAGSYHHTETSLRHIEG
jgi:hypothetical protein